MSSTEQRAALLERRIDVGFARHGAADPAVEFAILSKERPCLALPADHPRAHQENLRLGDLVTEGFILFSRDLNPDIHDATIATCQNAGFSPRVAQEGNDAHTILVLIAAGLGVGMLPASLQKMPAPGVVFRDLPPEDTPEIELSLIWRRRERSPLVELFVETARAVAHARQT